MKEKVYVGDVYYTRSITKVVVIDSFGNDEHKIMFCSDRLLHPGRSITWKSDLYEPSYPYLIMRKVT
jgi:hypothetical protein